MNDTSFSMRTNFFTVVLQSTMRMMPRLQKPKLVNLHSTMEYHVYLTVVYLTQGLWE